MTAQGPKEAIANARDYQTYAKGYCLRFVRHPVWDLPPLFASAIEAWNGAQYKHPGDRTPPLGAPLFYRGGQYGHIVICTGTNLMRSTDCHTATKVSEDTISWTERAWGYTYLGWTEDLNGVRLPLGGEEEDEMSPDDWKKMQTMLDATVNKVWAEKIEVTKPGTGEKVKKEAKQILRETWQKVTKAT